VEATRGITAVVEAMHRTIASGPAVLGAPLRGPATRLTGAVYGGIRGVAALVGTAVDSALGRLAPLLGQSVPGPEREAVLAALNGVLGDYLQETGNPLAIEMRLRHAGQPLALEPEALRAVFPDAGGRLVVLVHGSSMNDLQWRREGHDHGAALARDLGLTPLSLHYNTGLHVSTNGRALSDLLERTVAAWPVPVEALVLVGHSMGGLVARSACHAAELDGRSWRRTLRALVCLGTPHQGAPLERAGSWLQVLLGVSRYSAPIARLGRIRSAGVTDLRHGAVLDEDWRDHDRFALASAPRTTLPLPAGVRCYAIAGTTAKGPGSSRLPGDGLVPVDSALGRHRRPELALAFPPDHQSIAWGTRHTELLSSPEVYATLRAWLAAALAPAVGTSQGNP
jgi:pimeloyl-ACP methyl ester carboxylesterase